MEEYRENLKDILNIRLWWGLDHGNIGIGDRWDLKRKMKIGEKKTKDMCNIEERKVKKWIKGYEDMAVSCGIGLEKMNE